jgi:hypothetical protein
MLFSQFSFDDTVDSLEDNWKVSLLSLKEKDIFRQPTTTNVSTHDCNRI